MRRILIALLVCFALFTAAGFFLPSGWEVERELLIAAPAQRIEAALRDEASWPEWFPPWTEAVAEGKDLEFTPDGDGLRWKEPQGEGTLIVDGEAGQLTVRVKMGGHEEEATVSLAEVEGGTMVRWRTSGDFGWNPWRRWISVTDQVEEVVGKKLDEVLAMLATHVAAQNAGG